MVETGGGPPAWSDVDRAPDPSGLAAYLDVVGSMAEAQGYKRQTFAALKVAPGHHVLDLGCGTGEDVRMLAELVGPTGRVLGVDSSNFMVAEAKRRTAGTGLPAEFLAASVYDLPLPDGTFDACRADRLFQHLEEPRRALCEMIRVVHSGGRVVVSEPDWETLLVDADRVVTRKILNARSDRFRSGWIGRQLAGLFWACGLIDVVTMPPTTVVITNYEPADAIFGLRGAADHARDAGVVSVADAAAWLRQLEEADRLRRFFSAATLFAVAGTRA
jgi:SAM-dependent methyltransferase